MLPFTKDSILNLKTEDIQELSRLDSYGFIPGNGESFDKYKQRLLQTAEAISELDEELEATDSVEIFESVKLRKEDRISGEIIEEAALMTQRLYQFSIKWVPGFFLSRNVGLLWGGCAITDTEKPLTVFLVRGNFRKQQRWFIYNRKELLAHELCHAARNILRDYKLEEFYAYQTAPSRIRRYMGNCFIAKYDALLFLLPVLVLLAAQSIQTFAEINLPILPFWIFALAYPGYLLVRNYYARHRFFKACNKLSKFGIKAAGAVLFRCNWRETGEISQLKSEAELKNYISSLANKELRWKIIQQRFILTNDKTDSAS